MIIHILAAGSPCAAIPCSTPPDDPSFAEECCVSNDDYAETTCLHDPSRTCHFSCDTTDTAIEHFQALAGFFSACGGAKWKEPGSGGGYTTWCEGTNTDNIKCGADVITDPCTGELWQYGSSQPAWTQYSYNYAQTTWMGLTCDDDHLSAGDINHIDLSDHQIGKVGASRPGPCDLHDVDLSALVDLHTLDLSSNSIAGQIPASLAGLSTLTQLRLEDNALNGTIPPEFGDGVELLVTLNLERNNVRLLSVCLSVCLSWLGLLCSHSVPTISSYYRRLFLYSFASRASRCTAPFRRCPRAS